MHLAVVGLNHHTASIDIRERLAFSQSSLPGALERLVTIAGASEGAILSTCNRTELYAVISQRDAGDALVRFLSEHHHIPESEFAGKLYRHDDSDAVRHLLRVASGLDSMVLGEPQVLAQVREAFATAADSGAAGSLLNALFRAAVSTGKRARTETGIGRGGFSVGHAAVDLARSIFGSLEHAGILILGAGKMSELTAKHLVAGGAKVVLVANRTYERAVALAGQLGGQAINYDQFPDALVKADVVISSTASPHPIIDRSTLQPVMRRRRGRPLFLVDIAVPRDISPEVAGLDNVFLYDLDDLEEVVSDMTRERAGEVERVESIVSEETEKFVEWWRSLAAVPVLTRLKEKHEAIRQAEIARLRNQLPGLPPEAWDRIEAATRSMMNRVARDPVASLKTAATQTDMPEMSLLEAAAQLFALDSEPATVEIKADTELNGTGELPLRPPIQERTEEIKR